MRAVYNPGDCVKYHDRCYKIKGRNHDLDGVGYNLVGYPDPVNQADLAPCEDDECGSENEADTIDIDAEVMDSPKKDFKEPLERSSLLTKVKVVGSHNLEIERKFMVNPTRWKNVTPERSAKISQAYLSTNPDCTVQLRITDEQAFLTIKGKRKLGVNAEYEYPIPLAEAEEMIKMGQPPLIEKVRHYVTVEGKTWEVDEFKGRHAGLMIAEIELSHIDEYFVYPEWVLNEVTEDVHYTNAYLAQH